MKKARWFITLVAIIGLALTVSQAVYAEESTSGEKTAGSEQLKIGGYLKLNTGYRLVEPDQAGNDLDSFTTFRLKLSSQVVPDVRAFVSFNVQGLDSFAEGINPSLQEGYLEIHGKNMDLRAGKQVVVWGTADSFNPTDNLNPKDYTTGSLEVEDQRVAIPALRLDYYLGRITLGGVWIPYFMPAKLPVIPGLPVLPNNLFHEPEKTLNNSEYALKASTSVQGVDLSASYFSGWDDWPTVHMTYSPLPAPTSVDYHRLQVAGADFSTAYDKFTFRGETAYFQTEDKDGKDPAIANPHVQYVLGADYAYNDDLSFLAQFSQDIKTQYDEAIDRERKRTSLAMVRTNYKFTEYVTGEITGVYSIDDKASLVNPELSYDLADATNLKAGAIIYTGKPDPAAGSVYKENFGNLDKEDRLYVQLKYSF